MSRKTRSALYRDQHLPTSLEDLLKIMAIVAIALDERKRSHRADSQTDRSQSRLSIIQILILYEYILAARTRNATDWNNVLALTSTHVRLSFLVLLI